MTEVEQFEKLIADFYGAPYAVAVDCCTHALELCLRVVKPGYVTCPKHTYLSVPMTFEKLGINWDFDDRTWRDYYYLGGTCIADAAVHWEAGSYYPATMMCLSFQFKKHLNIGKGGMILLDSKTDYEALCKLRYDGRSGDVPWAQQSVETLGYHYYMTPETAIQGIEKFKEAVEKEPRSWTHEDYPDLTTMPVFGDKRVKQE